MNWEQVQGKWEQWKGQIKTQWGKLTDNDVDQISGKREQLEGRLRELYGLKVEEAKRQVDEFLAAGTRNS